MTTPVKTLSPKVPLPAESPSSAPWSTQPANMEERLQRIGVMMKGIAGYVQFMDQVGTLSGISGEAKERAVSAFYERIVVMERQLAHIHEELRLS
jgi:hypothetical protein